MDFSAVSGIFDKILKFLPTSPFITFGEAWLVAIGLFYAYQIILRWIKAIE